MKVDIFFDILFQYGWTLLLDKQTIVAKYVNLLFKKFLNNYGLFDGLVELGKVGADKALKIVKV